MVSSFKSGFIAIIGPPNVGKSTFINAVVGEKVSIVSPKPQTTRNRVIGIKTLSQGQLIFVDTPGTHRTRKRFNRHLVEIARSSFRESDAILVMVEASKSYIDKEFDYIRKGLQQTKNPVLLLINKVDLVKKEALLPLIEAYSSSYHFQEIFPVSALTGLGVDRIEQSLLDYLPEGPRYFPESMYTDLPERFLAGEIIREKIFFLIQKEVPYSITVEVDQLSEGDDGIIFIRASIWVEKKSQKGILIGKQGRMLKEIGTRARKEIEGFLNSKVYLELWVTVKRNWTLNEAAIRQSLAL
ncbi:MAG: GTPase Era [Thermoplasmata archaeon]|nr:MAG: GTPase Era [Thermoplasmata archaeon]